MTRAAEVLNVAQPALGLQMRQLEQELGVPLLERHSRGVVPTSAGHVLFERCREILELVERTREEVSAFRAPAMETLRLGLTPSLMQLVASDLLVRARHEVPGMQLHLIEDMSFVLMDALRRGELDMALAYDAPEEAGLSRTPWLREELLFVSAPGPDAGPVPGTFATIDLAEALRSELAMAGSRDPMRQMLSTAAASLSIAPRIAFEVQSVPAMKILVADGLAASILPFGSVATDLASGRLVGRRIIRPALLRTLHLITTPRALQVRSAAALLKTLEVTRARLFSLLQPLGRAIEP